MHELKYFEKMKISYAKGYDVGFSIYRFVFGKYFLNGKQLIIFFKFIYLFFYNLVLGLIKNIIIT